MDLHTAHKLPFRDEPAVASIFPHLTLRYASTTPLLKAHSYSRVVGMEAPISKPPHIVLLIYKILEIISVSLGVDKFKFFFLFN